MTSAIDEIKDLPVEFFTDESKKELKAGVQVVDTETNDVVASGDMSSSGLFPSLNLKPGDPGFMDDDVRGDYFDVRNIICTGSSHALVKACDGLPVPRLMLVREHLIHLSAYHDEWRDILLKIALIITRVIVGDKTTDLERPDEFWEPPEGEDEADSGEDEPTASCSGQGR
jgi:hypothetical protein